MISHQKLFKICFIMSGTKVKRFPYQSSSIWRMTLHFRVISIFPVVVKHHSEYHLCIQAR